MSIRLHHVGLNVVNLTAAREYWGGVTGLDMSDPVVFSNRSALAAQLGLQTTALKVCNLIQPDAQLELIELPDGSPQPVRREVNEPGITHVCFRLPKGRGGFDRFVAAGAASHHPHPVTLPTGIEYAYLRDSEHVVCELEQLDIDRCGNRPDDGTAWMGHVGLSTIMIDELSAFYAEILGPPIVQLSLPPKEELDQVTGMTGVRARWTSWLTDDAFRLELWQYDAPAASSSLVARKFTDPGWSHVGFAVDDLAAERERLVAAGARFDDDPVWGEFGGTLFGYDPQGTMLELLQVRDGQF